MTKPRHLPPSRYTVAPDLIQGLIDCAAKCRIPALGTFREQAGAPVPGLASARYSVHQVLALWARCIRLSNDPIIGYHMALFAEAKTFGLLGQIMSRSATVLDALRQAERYSTVTSQAARISVECDASALTVSVAVDAPPGPVTSNVLLWGLTNLSLFPHRFAQSKVVPRSIECAAPSFGAAHDRVLRQRLPITLGAMVNRIVFDRRIADLRVLSADPQLCSVLSEVLDQRKAELEPAVTFEHGLSLVLRGMMNGTMPTLASLAARSGLSPRTLQRRLSESNTSFQRLLQQVLHDASDDLLARGTMTQGEIAFLLGYSEESAFSRAYRSWTGHPPGAPRPRNATVL